jgi:hypothetical protein
MKLKKEKIKSKNLVTFSLRKIPKVLLELSNFSMLSSKNKAPEI